MIITEYVVLKSPSGMPDCFIAFYDHGESYVSEWDYGRKKWKDHRSNHEGGIEVAAHYVRSGYLCRSTITGKTVENGNGIA